MSVRITDQYGLAWNATIDDSSLDEIARRVEERIRRMSGNVEREGERMDKVFSNLKVAAAGFFSARFGTELIKKIIDVRSQFQQLEISFTTMLKSREKADRLMGQLTNFAATTPFGLNEVASSAKQLLAYGFQVNDIKKELTTLGDIAAGVGSQIGDLIYLYGTLKASGRVTQMDINQFAGRGIPIYEALAKVLNTTTDQVRQFVSAGKVGFEDIQKAFDKLAGSGGQFNGLMNNLSASFEGRLSNLQDLIESVYNEIGKANEGIVGDAIDTLAYLVEHYKEIGKILTVLIATYGSYRAALIVTNALEAARIAYLTRYGFVLGNVTIAQRLALVSTDALRKGIKALGAAMIGNPIGATVAIIGGLAAAMYVLSDSTTSTERAQKQFNETMNETAGAVDDLRSKSDSLINTINNDTQTRQAQIIAFEDLQKLYKGRLTNLDLESFKLMEVAEQQRLVNVALSEYTIEALKARRAETADVIAKKGALEGRGTIAGEWDAFLEDMRDILTMENSRAKRLEDAKRLEALITSEIDRQLDAKKLAAMSDEELVQYAKERLEPLKKQVEYWEAALGPLKRNNDGVLEIGDNMAALTIQPLIDQYNRWLGIIRGVNAELNPNSPRNKAFFEQRGKEIDEKLENINKDEFLATFKRNQLLKQKADNDKELEWWNPEKSEKEAEKARKKAEREAAKAGREAKKQREERLKFLQELNDAYEEQTNLQKTENEKQIADTQRKYQKMREAAKEAGIDLKKEGGIAERIRRMEEAELGSDTYRENTDTLFKNLDRDLDNFTRYESAKTQIGDEEAKKRFDIEEDYLAKLLKFKKEVLAEEAGAGRNERLEGLNDRIATETRRRKQNEYEKLAAEREMYVDLLREAGDYNQLIIDLSKKRDKELRGLDQLRLKMSKDDYEKHKKLITDTFAMTAKQLSIETAPIFKRLNTRVSTATKAELNTMLKDINKMLRDGKMTDGAGNLVDIPPDVLLRLESAKQQLRGIITQVDSLSLSETKLRNVLQLLGGLAQTLQSIGSNLGSESDAGQMMGNMGAFLNDLITAYKGIRDAVKILTTATQAADGVAKSVGNVLDSNDWIGAILAIINIIVGFFGATRRYKEALAEVQRQFAAEQSKVYLGEFKITEAMREQNRLQLESISLTKARLKATKELAEAQTSEIQAEFERIMKDIQGGEFKSGSYIKERSGIAKLFGGKPKIITTYSKLGGFTYEQIYEEIKRNTQLNDKMRAEYLQKIQQLQGGDKDGKMTIAELQKFFTENYYVNPLGFNLLIKAFEDLDKAGKGVAVTFDELKELDARGMLDGATKEMFDRLVELEKQGADAKKIWEDTVKQINELNTGTTADAIADSIAQGFLEGKRSIADFADTFEQYMRDAMINSLKYNTLQGPLQEWYAEFAKAATDGIINEQEKEFLKTRLGQIIKNADDQAKLLEQASGISLTNPKNSGQNTMSKALAAASQDSINILSGHTQGMRLAQLLTNEILSVNLTELVILANKKLVQLELIQINTLETVKELRFLNSKIQNGTDIARAAGG